MVASDRSSLDSLEEIHLAVLQALPEGLCFADRHGLVRVWNDAAEAICGFSVAEALCARRWEEVFFLSGADGLPAALPLEPGIGFAFTRYFLRHKDGHAVPVQVRRLPVRAQDQQPLGILNVFTVSEGAARPLTNDPRPAWLKPPASDASLPGLGEAVRPAAVLMVEIDDFAKFEQRLGPEAAEKLVALVERTTANCLKSEDDYGRLPDGRLLVSIRAAAPLQELGERLRALIHSARFQWWGEPVSVTVSIGAAVFRASDSIEEVVSRVEDCVLRAGQGGGNRVVLAE